MLPLVRAHTDVRGVFPRLAPARSALFSVLLLSACGSDEPETAATTSTAGAAAATTTFDPAATAGDGGAATTTTGFMPVTTGASTGGVTLTSGATTGATSGGMVPTTGFVPVTTSGTSGGGTTGAVGGFTTGASGGLTTGAAGGFTTGAAGGLTTGAPAGTTTGAPLDSSVTQPDPSKLPTVNGTCPDMSRDGTVQVAGSGVVLTVGSKPGPVYFYFHGTGTSPGEVDQGIPGAKAAVKSSGGFVASFDSSNGMGMNTGTIWYTGDLDAADQLVACGIEAGIVDTGRIHAAGYSAGGLETGSMVLSRSTYLASVIVYSGGQPGAGFGGFGGGSFADPSNIPAMLGAHGAAGSDSLGIDFGTATPALGMKIKDAGGFAMDCDDGGGHITFSRLGVGGQAKKFFDDHPYNTKPSPYASGIPSGYPSNCKIL